MKLRFRLFDVPGVMASDDTIFFNKKAPIVYDVHTSDTEREAIISQECAGGFLMHLLDEGHIDIDVFEDRMHTALRLWNENELAKEFRTILRTYEKTPPSAEGKIIPGSFIDLEYDIQTKKAVCTGFMLHFEGEPDKGKTCSMFMKQDIQNTEQLAERIADRVALDRKVRGEYKGT